MEEYFLVKKKTVEKIKLLSTMGCKFGYYDIFLDDKPIDASDLIEVLEISQWEDNLNAINAKRILKNLKTGSEKSNEPKN